jgi:hypothetical protein
VGSRGLLTASWGTTGGYGTIACSSVCGATRGRASPRCAPTQPHPMSAQFSSLLPTACLAVRTSLTLGRFTFLWAYVSPTNFLRNSKCIPFVATSAKSLYWLWNPRCGLALCCGHGWFSGKQAYHPRPSLSHIAAGPEQKIEQFLPSRRNVSCIAAL